MQRAREIDGSMQREREIDRQMQRKRERKIDILRESEGVKERKRNRKSVCVCER